MSIRARYQLSNVINARGTFTPLGVSRSSPEVAAAVADALSDYFIIDELQLAARKALAEQTGAEAGAVVHCSAAGITLAVAACMTGTSAERIAALPDATGMSNRVVLPAGHAVNYGQPILQAIRLAGAAPVLAGSEAHCGLSDIEDALSHPETSCLLLVSSRLSRGATVELSAAVAAAHRRGVPALIDGAAQDMRMRSLVETGADAVIVSAQKYLAAPTAGIVLGRDQLIQALLAQERGIGRAMKATKEAIVGVLAALDQRQRWDEITWSDAQSRKLTHFIETVNGLSGVNARAVPDLTGLPFARAHITLAPNRASLTAAVCAHRLRSGIPKIFVMDHRVSEGEIVLELVQLRDDEIAVISSRLAELLG